MQLGIFGESLVWADWAFFHCLLIQIKYPSKKKAQTDQNAVSQLEANVQQDADIALTRNMSHTVSPTELQPSTLFTLGVMLQLDLVRHSMCDAMLGSGDADKRWKSLELP